MKTRKSFLEALFLAMVGGLATGAAILVAPLIGVAFGWLAGWVVGWATDELPVVLLRWMLGWPKTWDGLTTANLGAVLGFVGPFFRTTVTKGD